MNMEFRTILGNQMTIDEERWIMTSNPACKIIGETQDDYTLENSSKKKVNIPKSIIQDNQLEILDNQVNLGKDVYDNYFKKNTSLESIQRMDKLFEKHLEDILKNRKVVLKKAEYFLLRPTSLTSGGMLTQGFTYALGSLIESIESGNHTRFEELYGHRDLYLLKCAGSELSGSFWAMFWSDYSSKIVEFSSRKGHGLHMSYISLLKDFKSKVTGMEIRIDFQDEAMEQLIKEVSKGSN